MPRLQGVDWRKAGQEVSKGGVGVRNGGGQRCDAIMFLLLVLGYGTLAKSGDTSEFKSSSSSVPVPGTVYW